MKEEQVFKPEVELIVRSTKSSTTMLQPSSKR